MEYIFELVHFYDSFDLNFANLISPVLEFFKLMNEVENEDLVFILETIVDKFGEEMAPKALGLCQNLVLLASIFI